MSETLFDIARSNVQCANVLLQQLESDPREWNICAFHIQQAVEIGLKSLLEFNRKGYEHSDTIVQLLYRVEKYDLDMVWVPVLFEKLFLFAGTFDYWHAYCRDVKDWFVDPRSMLIGYKLAVSMLERIAAHIGQSFMVTEIPQTALATLNAESVEFLRSNFDYAVLAAPN